MNYNCSDGYFGFPGGNYSVNEESDYFTVVNFDACVEKNQDAMGLNDLLKNFCNCSDNRTIRFYLQRESINFEICGVQ